MSATGLKLLAIPAWIRVDEWLALLVSLTGYFAWRNSTRGSWFIQALVDVLRDNWKRMDLLSMMTRVSRKVAYDFESNASKEFMNRKKQIPCITSMLTRDVYFTPKKWVFQVVWVWSVREDCLNPGDQDQCALLPCNERPVGHSVEDYEGTTS